MGESSFRDASPHCSHLVDVNGIRLHYLDWGGQGEPLLCLTGGGDSAHVFDDLAPCFTGRFRVLALSRRGHGESERPALGYDTDTLVSDIAGFLDALQLQRVTLLGHSLAGSELTRFAVRFRGRARRLIYLDSGFDYGELMAIARTRPAVASGPRAYDRTSFDAYRTWRQRLHGFWSPAMEANLRAILEVTPEGTVERKMPRAAVAAIFRGMAESHAEYARVQAPALAIYSDDLGRDRVRALTDDGERERLIEWQRSVREPFLRRQIARFRREMACGQAVEMHDTHHYCFVQRQAEVVEIVKRWLDSLDTPA